MILLAINSVVDKEKMVIRIHPSDKAHAEAFSIGVGGQACAGLGDT